MQPRAGRLSDLFDKSVPASMRLRRFDDIVVHPTYKMLIAPLVLFHGGPAWPRFWLQRGVRHCRYRLSLPLDSRPPGRTADVEDQEPIGIWCGPVSDHFGHAIADFGGRLAYSGQLRLDAPLVFSALPGGKAPPRFFFQMLSHFGIDAERVKIISRPTRFDHLYVLPQAERHFGGAPDADYLALLDQIATTPPSPSDGTRLFISRAGLPRGRIAGESYLEDILQQAGFDIFRPELFSLEEQILRYRKADHLLFSEGSAIHALQLLGSVPAKVTVIRRRKGHRIAERAIGARAKSIDYVDCVAGQVYGARPNGSPQRSTGMAVLDPRRCVPSFAKVGIDIERLWNEAAYIERRDRDIADWIEHRRSLKRSFLERSFLRLTLARVGMSLTV